MQCSLGYVLNMFPFHFYLIHLMYYSFMLHELHHSTNSISLTHAVCIYSNIWLVSWSIFTRVVRGTNSECKGRCSRLNAKIPPKPSPFVSVSASVTAGDHRAKTYRSNSCPKICSVCKPKTGQTRIPVVWDKITARQLTPKN